MIVSIKYVYFLSLSCDIINKVYTILYIELWYYHNIILHRGQYCTLNYDIINKVYTILYIELMILFNIVHWAYDII